MPFIHPQQHQLLAAIAIPHPIVISGPPNSGKSTLANSLPNVIHLPLNSSQDPKDLFGQITCGQTPGQFFFRPGPLSRAVESGQTIIIEAGLTLEIDEIVGAVFNNENLLLISRTGIGKTFTLQVASKLLGNELLVINFSNQTEISDLIGGFKPVNLTGIGAILYKKVVQVISEVLEVKEERNVQFIQRLYECFEQQKFEELSRFSLSFVREFQKQKMAQMSSEQHAMIVEIVGYCEQIQKFKNSEQKFYFQYKKGILIEAMEKGTFILFDEINLAPVEVLEYIQQLLQNDSLVIPDFQDENQQKIQIVKKHSNFRIFASMNPATDIGKKQLPEYIQQQFTSLYCTEMTNRDDIQCLIRSYLENCTTEVEDIVDSYFQLKKWENTILKTVNGQNPVFSIRLLCRALKFAQRHFVTLSLKRALFEGFSLFFTSNLDQSSTLKVNEMLKNQFSLTHSNLQFKAQIENLPFLKQSDQVHVIDNIYFPIGPNFINNQEYNISIVENQNQFVLTDQNRLYLTAILKSLLSNTSVLLEGVTSSGKSSLITFLGKQLGYDIIRINNHENTDLQDYLGSFQPNPITGQLQFSYGPLIRAMKNGSWVILDELNLCSSEVLEALNRLLDDNSEIYISETNETVRPSPGFALFATQNPPGIVNGTSYGGRKQLSEAFKNRFVMIEVGEITQKELEFILTNRNGGNQLPQKFITGLVQICADLKVRLQNVVNGANVDLVSQIITLRDLFRVADRLPTTIQELGMTIFMLFGERQRNEENKQTIINIINKHLKIDMDEAQIADFYNKFTIPIQQLISTSPKYKKYCKLVFTPSFNRIFALTLISLQNHENPTLIGDCGAGKTQVSELISDVLNSKFTQLNLHKNSDVSDFVGQLRPVRNRGEMQLQLEEMKQKCDVNEFYKSEVQSLENQMNKIFTWYDGPLVDCMIKGKVLLIDEISLASDSILERLNSVFETSRELTIAEKPCSSGYVTRIVANQNFYCISTMNPGNDYGKKELSPALRNRMTEIYVQGITQENEVEQILKLRQDIETQISIGKYKLYEGLTIFFRIIMCMKDQFYLGHNFSFSIRDLVSIFDHISYVYNGQNTIQPQLFFQELELCYIHGLQVKLGHPDQIYVLKLKQFIIDQLQQYFDTPIVEQVQEQIITLEQSSLHLSSPQIYLKFGPFFNRELSANMLDKFCINSPTTVKNASMILRAITNNSNKPILLESAPGVGKTSIIQNLTEISGFQLCRINLSEHIDLSDLIGQDLPSDDGQFKFTPGVLLTAILNNQWILLDELNLANQAVLEGLNSLFDHRKQIYIPEINKTIVLSNDIKIFAAQNPSWQGGGRKVLPQSFLNRFNCLFLDKLDSSDYEFIISKISNNQELAEKLIQILQEIQEKVGIEFGEKGGPWEINLRDVYRILDFIKNSQIQETDFYLVISLSLLLRFRGSTDAIQGLNIIQKYIDSASIAFPLIKIDNNNSQISLGNLKFQFQKCANFIVSDYPLLYAISVSVNSGTPILLTTDQGSGLHIDRLISQISQINGEKIHQVSLAQSTDITDILGCYEQLSLNTILIETVNILNFLLIHNKLSDLETFKTEIYSNVNNNITEEEAKVYFKSLMPFVESNHHIFQLSHAKLYDNLLQQIKLFQFYENQQLKGQFIWVDGVVTKAIESGQWIHFLNANFCSASVLDRLNSLLERDSVLYLFEQGTQELRQLEIHENFRVFISYDVKFGDVSRAIRNRCFEICVDNQSFLQQLFQSENIILTYDNLRENDMSMDISDPIGANVFKQLIHEFPIYSKQQLTQIAEIIMQRNYKSYLDSDQYLLLSSIDTYDHSRIITFKVWENLLSKFFAYIISYQYQNLKADEILINTLKIDSSIDFNQLVPIFTQYILKAEDRLLQNDFCNNLVSQTDQTNIENLILKVVSLELTNDNLLYQVLQQNIQSIQISDLQFQFQQFTSLQKLSDQEKYIINIFINSLQYNSQDKFKFFRKAVEIENYCITQSTFLKAQQFLQSINFQVQSQNFSYQSTNLIDILMRKDKLMLFQPQPSNIFIETMIVQLLENIQFFNNLAISPSNLINHPLLQLLTNLFNKYPQVSSKQQKDYLQELQHLYNMILYNNKQLTSGMSQQIESKIRFISDISRKLLIPELPQFNSNVAIKNVLYQLIMMYQHADFSGVFDQSMIANLNNKYSMLVIELLKSQKLVFQQHQIVTQSRIYKEENDSSLFLQQLMTKYEELHQESLSLNIERIQFDDQFYQDMQKQIELLNIQKLLQILHQPYSDVYIQYLEQYHRNIFQFFIYLSQQKLELILSYFDMLLPILFILSNLMIFINLLISEINEEQNISKNQEQHIIIQLFQNSVAPYQAVRSITTSIDFANAYYSLFIKQNFMIQNQFIEFIGRNSILSLNQLAYIASSHEEGILTEVKRVLLERSPFRSRHFTKSNDYDKEIDMQLQEMFPSYGDDFRKVLELNERNDDLLTQHAQLKDSHKYICGLGEVLINLYLNKEKIISNQVEVNFDQINILMQLMGKKLYLKDTQSAVFILHSLQAIFKKAQQNSTKNSTVLSKIKSNKSRRGEICQNIYKNPYPSEVSLAINSLTGFVTQFNQFIKEFPEDARLTQIDETYQLLLNLPILTPLSKFLTGFEQLLSLILQWNSNSPLSYQYKIEVVNAIKQTIIHWRRIELMSWNTFFNEIQQEQVNSALLDWPQLLLGALTASSSENFSQFKLDFQNQFQTFLLDSTFGQFQTKLDLITAIIQVLKQSQNQFVNEVIESLILLISRYERFSQLIVTQIQEDEKSIKSEFQDQIKLFQWDERNFVTLQRDLTKSHRKTLEIIRKFSEVLQKPVKILYEKFSETSCKMVNIDNVQLNVELTSILQNVIDIHDEKLKKNQLEFKLRGFIDNMNQYFGIVDSTQKLFNIDKLSQIERISNSLNMKSNCQIIDFYQQFLIVNQQINTGLQDADISRLLKIINFLLEKYYSSKIQSIQQYIALNNINLNGQEQIRSTQNLVVYIQFIAQNILTLREILGENSLVSEVQININDIQTYYIALQKFQFNSPQFNQKQKQELTLSIMNKLIVVKQQFADMIQLYSQKLNEEIFSNLLQNNTFLYDQVGVSLDIINENIFVMIQNINIDEQILSNNETTCNEMQQQELTTFLPIILQLVTALFKHGYKEKQQEEEQKDQQSPPEDGIGLGDAKGDNAINDQVKEEDLSDDQLLGNDRDDKQEQQENDENDDGIDMDREFDGENQSIQGNEEDEEEKDENEDLEKEMNDEEGENQDKKRKQTEESEEEQEGSNQKDDELNSQENDLNPGSNDGESDVNDISEQNPEYQDPDVQEEFEELEDNKEENPEQFSMQTDMEDEKSEEATNIEDEIFDEIFQDEIENPIEEEKLEEIDQKFEEKQEEDEDNEECEDENKPEKEQQNDDERENYQNDENIDENGFQNGNNEEEKEEEQDEAKPEIDNIEQQQENKQGEDGDDEEEEDETQDQNDKSQPAKNKTLNRDLKKQKNIEKKDQNQIEFSENEKSDQIEVNMENNVTEVVSDSENSESAQIDAENDQNLIKAWEAENENQTKVNTISTVQHAENEVSEVQENHFDAFRSTLNLQNLQNSSATLAEKLKIVLEPKQTSSLIGDFKSGKKLNLRKIIPFIASNYRKDKIWLRRNSPQKRNYNVVCLVDNSFSLVDLEVQNQLFYSILTVFQAVKSAEIGKFGLVKFGVESQILIELNDILSESQVEKALRGVDFSCQKSDFAGGLKTVDEMLQNSLCDDNLVLVFTDGIINEKQNVGENLRKLQKISIPLFIIHNINILQQQSVKFVEVDGKKKVVKNAYLQDDYPVTHYCVCECQDLATELCGAIVQFISNM